MTILIGMPTPEYVHADFALANLPKLIAYTKQQRPDVKILMLHEMGVRTDANRNKILKEALDHKESIDYILWLDTDMIYPEDMIVKYLEADRDIISCIYFKRSEPYQPVVYISENEGRYKPLDPSSVSGPTPVNVVAAGFGGMMVKLEVYRSMGSDMWMNYGKYFHIPDNVGTAYDHNTHDIVFCREAIKRGYKVYVHPQVRAGHLATQLITEQTYQEHNKKTENRVIGLRPGMWEPKICVIMPSIDVDKAKNTMRQLSQTSGWENTDYIIAVDHNRVGFVRTFYDAALAHEADYYVYVAEDAYGKEAWLRWAVGSIQNNKVVAFNDCKWLGKLASFGLVEREYLLANWCLEYKSHYVDVELTQKAKRDNCYGYSEKSYLIELDDNKHEVNQADKKLWNQRKNNMGLSLELQEEFS